MTYVPTTEHTTTDADRKADAQWMADRDVTGVVDPVSSEPFAHESHSTFAASAH